MIKTIFCDLGNVIVLVDHQKTMQGLSRFSSRSEDAIYRFFLNSKARKRFDTGKITAEKFFMNFKDNLGLKLDFDRFRKIWCSCLINLNNDMEKLLRKLKKNYRLILLSNTDEIHFAYCRKNYRILDVFDDFVLSYEEGYIKPNPMIYLGALKKAGTFPANTVFIDDIAKHTIAARLLGIKGIQYKNMQKLRDDLRELNVKI